MVFINPKTDFGFKKIFGSDGHHDILISFLNGVLYKGINTIQNLEILNPYQAPRIRGVKSSYLDVKAQLDNGTTVIIEMQVLNVESFEKRILYNAAKAYSAQLDSGTTYSYLKPIIALTITNFVMFPSHAPWLSRFILKEKEFLFDYPVYDLELVFVELPKFKPMINQLLDLTDKWLFFLKNAEYMDKIPTTLESVEAIHQAFEVARRANLSREEIDELDNEEFFIQDQRGAIALAKRQALEQGIEQGIEQGAQNEQRAIAERLLPLLDDNAISQTTGLSIETIQQLRTS